MARAEVPGSRNPQWVPFVQLTLSAEEAEALYDVCWGISGPPTTRRGIFSDTPESILKQLEPFLEAIGYKHQPVHGDISFEEG